jgi:hypothetical protein
MAKSSLEADIRSRIESLAAELAGMVREEAMAAVTAALGGSGARPARRGPGRRRRGPGRPKGSGRKKAGRSRGRRGRPPSAAAEALVPKVLTQVKAKDGQGVSEIAKALRVDVDRVKPVMVKLLAAKQIKKTGQKRGTKYHAGGGGGGATAKAARVPAKRRRRKTARRKAAAKKAA